MSCYECGASCTGSVCESCRSSRLVTAESGKRAVGVDCGSGPDVVTHTISNWKRIEPISLDDIKRAVDEIRQMDLLDNDDDKTWGIPKYGVDFGPFSSIQFPAAPVMINTREDKTMATTETTPNCRRCGYRVDPIVHRCFRCEPVTRASAIAPGAGTGIFARPLPGDTVKVGERESCTVPRSLARNVAPDLETKAHPDALARAQEVAGWLNGLGLTADHARLEGGGYIRLGFVASATGYVSIWRDGSTGAFGYSIDDRDSLRAALLEAGVLLECAGCDGSGVPDWPCKTCSGTGVVPAELGITTSSPSAGAATGNEAERPEVAHPTPAEGGVCFVCGEPFSAYRPNRSVGGKGQGTCGDCLAPAHANLGDLDTRIAAARAGHVPEPERRHPHPVGWPSGSEYWGQD